MEENNKAAIYTKQNQEYKKILEQDEQYNYLKDEYKKTYYEYEKNKGKKINYICIVLTIICILLSILTIPWLIITMNFIICE